MAPRLLVEEEIESGRRLVETLDKRGVPIEAALWAYNPESERYQLVIGSGEVDTSGARPIYEQIQEALRSLPENQRVAFSDIAVTSSSTGVVRALSRAIHTSPNAISSIRITNNVVNRELIEDAYVYRMSVGGPTDCRITKGSA